MKRSLIPTLLSAWMLATALGLGIPGGAQAFPGDLRTVNGFFKANSIACYTRATIRRILDAEAGRNGAKNDASLRRLVGEDCIQVDGKPYVVINTGFVSSEVSLIDQGITRRMFTPTRDLIR
ncbi:MAG: hypothetical protein ACPGOV_13545 [Magnetovibrionaceae bacterium]